MYTVVTSAKYKRQLKKLTRSGKVDLGKLREVVNTLKNGDLLPEKYRDHRLTGTLRIFRGCHIAPDWILVYQKVEEDLVLYLFQTGSHSDLFE